MNEADVFINKLKRKLPKDSHQIEMLMTFMGMAGLLAEFISKNHKAKDLPMMVQYALFSMSANMIALISDEDEVEMKSMGDVTKNWQMSEQNQENIRRVMKEIITDLYHALNDEEQV